MFPFAVFISICRINCYVICLLNYSCHFIWKETYISNITSFIYIYIYIYIFYERAMSSPEK